MDNLKKTLIDLIIINFKDIGAKGAVISKNSKSLRRGRKTASSPNHSVSTIISQILANSEANKAEAGEKDNKELPEENLEWPAGEQESKKKEAVHGGYGTIRTYSGMSPDVKYTDYDQIWSHIGSFMAYSSHNSIKSAEIAMNNGEGTREMVGMETIEKAAKHFKYFVRGEVLGDIGYVPPFGLGISSTEWEKYRMMTQISFYRPLLKLMHSVI